MPKVSKTVLIPVVGLVLFAGVAAAAYFNVFKIPEKYLPKPHVSGEAAVQRAVSYVNTNMLSDGMQASSKEIKEENGLYAFKLTVQDRDYSAYVTKDAKLFFAEGIPQAIPLDQPLGGEQNKAVEIPKTDKPDVKIFVMSYCPFGLQAQKTALPVFDLLKDSADMSINFVNYAMHGKKEVDENLRQYCIEKEQKDKLAAYLKCFTATAPTAADGTADFAKCVTASQIDKNKLSACMASTDKQFSVTADFNDKSKWLSGNYPKFAVEDALNTQYNVQGSPTFIINGVDASSSLTERSPEKLKQLICSAFNNQPEACKTALAAEQPSTGFGTEAATDNSAAGGCGTN
ncbi:MAG: hypothetical protein MUD10_05130 [Candidatus Pacebacteria bacterium]|jgi:hypothetical protein|nr:hypothetical protein [Candidatus Paceibacterota bacterium]